MRKGKWGIVFGVVVLAGLLSAPALAIRCHFDTTFGPVVFDWNRSTGKIRGSYRNGAISGHRAANGMIRGDWRQRGSNRHGRFLWNMHKKGFSGNWKYSQDRAWRGVWNGTYRSCR